MNNAVQPDILYSVGRYRGPMPKDLSQCVPAASYGNGHVFPPEIGRIEMFRFIQLATYQQSKKHFRRTMRADS